MTADALTPSTVVTVAVTTWRAGTLAGARYVLVVRPTALGPTGLPGDAPNTTGLNAHTTVAFVFPVTSAVRVQVSPFPREPQLDVAPRLTRVAPKAGGIAWAKRRIDRIKNV